MSVFEDYQAGNITPAQALRALCSDLGETEDQLAPLQAQKDALRAQIAEIVARQDGPVLVPGFGKLTISAPSVSRGYDAKAIDALVRRLVSEAPEIAAQIAACEKVSSRMGSLRIERERTS